MPSYLVKCDPDQDFYVMWSSVVDAPTDLNLECAGLWMRVLVGGDPDATVDGLWDRAGAFSKRAMTETGGA